MKSYKPNKETQQNTTVASKPSLTVVCAYANVPSVRPGLLGEASLVRQTGCAACKRDATATASTAGSCSPGHLPTGGGLAWHREQPLERKQKPLGIAAPAMHVREPTRSSATGIWVHLPFFGQSGAGS